MLPGGANFINELSDAITQCRSMIIMLSEASLRSQWVSREVDFAMNHQVKFPNFKLIPVVVGDIEVPGFLQTINYLKMPNGELTLEFCEGLLQAFYPRDISLHQGTNRDLYASVSWRPDEADFTNAVCQLFARENFRLVGDSKDQRSFMKGDPHRVETIISSCGGLLAVLPYREDSPADGYTSPYMLAEIAFTQKYELPYVVVAETNVVLPEAVTKNALRVVPMSPTADLTQNPAIMDAIDGLDQNWKPPIHPHYIFYSTSFDDATRVQTVRKLTQSITGLRCMIGNELEDEGAFSIPQSIVNLIKNAFLVLADISWSEPNIRSLVESIYNTSIKSNAVIDTQHVKRLADALAINTLIEVGAARGSDVQYRLLASYPRRSPPFMLGDRKDIPYYKDAVEMLGIIHKLVYPFRRRILNHELRQGR